MTKEHKIYTMLAIKIATLYIYIYSVAILMTSSIFN